MIRLTRASNGDFTFVNPAQIVEVGQGVYGPYVVTTEHQFEENAPLLVKESPETICELISELHILKRRSDHTGGRYPAFVFMRGDGLPYCEYGKR